MELSRDLVRIMRRNGGLDVVDGDHLLIAVAVINGILLFKCGGFEFISLL